MMARTIWEHLGRHFSLAVSIHEILKQACTIQSEAADFTMNISSVRPLSILKTLDRSCIISS